VHPVQWKRQAVKRWRLLTKNVVAAIDGSEVSAVTRPISKNSIDPA